MTNPELRSMWLGEVKDMADRIIGMRTQLRDGLAANGKSYIRINLFIGIGIFRKLLLL